MYDFISERIRTSECYEEALFVLSKHKNAKNALGGPVKLGDVSRKFKNIDDNEKFCRVTVHI